VPPVPAPKKSGKSRSPWSLALLRGSLPRLVGYGLLSLFALDVVSVLVTYRPFQPESDVNLTIQLIERVGVPLVAFAFIFGSDSEEARRSERTVLKLLSISTFFAALAYVGLSVIAVTSNLRLYTRTVATGYQQMKDRVAVIERTREQIPSFNLQQLQIIYAGMVPAARAQVGTFSRPELEAKIITQIPLSVDGVRDANEKSRQSLRRPLMLTAARYCIGGIISAVLFLIIWENTALVRKHHILRPRDAPSLELEDKLVGGFSRVRIWAESLSLFIWLDHFRWFRRLRRLLGFRTYHER
jgi:hypothetical protein